MKGLFAALFASLTLVAGLPLTADPAPDAPPDPARIAFTVSMPRPETHTFQVEMRCEGLRDEAVELKMPAWSPGDYVILDYAKNLGRFEARDSSGRALKWEKTAKNVWRVATGGASPFTVTYNVWAMGSSIAESSLDERQAFLSPTSLFLHPAGRIGTPVTVTVTPREGWPRISTGLAPVKGRPGSFSAPDFDILYDSPILVGDQEVLSFEVNGIPHTFEGRDLGKLDRVRFTADLKAMVNAATNLMGDIPYERYAFISIGPGGGGLEHLNSQLITFDAAKMADPVEYRRTLRFIAHEYFHHFNVKRIRPIALGPFDDDRENYTRMMWVSEGFTVYYEDLLLVRNGFTTREEYLERLGQGLSAYESSPGRRFQSPADSSFDSWFGYFDRNEHLRNTTVSPYDSGLVLALLLDFRIRHETRNRRSLDDVMRTLYRTYAKEKGRGFTDDEFRRVCEGVAGVPLAEIFDRYVATTDEIDYERYLAYGGLEVADEAGPGGGDLGADLEERNGKVVVTRVGIGSELPSRDRAQADEILAVDAVHGDVAQLRELLSGRRPGEVVKILVSRLRTVRELNVTLGAEIRAELSPPASPGVHVPSVLHLRKLADGRVGSGGSSVPPPAPSRRRPPLRASAPAAITPPQ